MQVALQKLHNFFDKKYWRISDINVRNFNETSGNDVGSFEQPGPSVLRQHCVSVSPFIQGRQIL